MLAGPGKPHPDTGKLIPQTIKEGDLVLLNERAGEKVDYCGEKHIFVSADEVLGVFEVRRGSDSPPPHGPACARRAVRARVWQSGSCVVDNFKPLKDNVLVKLEEAASETSSGIALATEGSEEPTQGEVLAVGEGAFTSQGELMPTGISPGDSVVYGKFAAADATIEGKTYKVVAAADCLAKW